ncbi:MAG: F0F1 ATP synthase subunit gamma [Planctomycetota bacterium]|jgi:F-type H+-transporting ATPase subunit gamma
MESVEAIKKKINSAQELQSVVRTMKALAAVSIRQFERAVESLGDYYRTVELALRAVMLGGWKWSGAKEKAGERRIAAIVFGSDQGMCGQFNETIADFAEAAIKELQSNAALRRVVAVGARAAGSLENRDIEIDFTLSTPGSIAGVTDIVAELLVRIEHWQAENAPDTVLLFHNRPLGGVSYDPVKTILLPIDETFFSRIGEEKWPNRSLPMFTIEPELMVSSLFSQYFFISIFRAQVESLASENAGRLASMQAAEKNIDDRLKELVRYYNHERQLSITSELLDIVSGFEALSSGK